MASIVRTSAFRSMAKPSMLRASVPGLMLAQRRFIATDRLTPAENMALLNTQREKRPTSPHLAIYQPQITAVMSGLNRITGVALSGALYLSAMAYLLHPVFPAIDSAHLVQIAHDLPVWAKTGFKVLLAAPFTYHTYNGIRHLGWDMGKGLTIKGVYATGYTVIAATAVSSIYLAFFV
ncbi:succinate dehydrogenase, cytochrome b556 subunit [Kwoniella shandongensis]|uniref:Succinate dehydrogenase, cytochrome b556 subunit n=1 Tax=Kwoniella shandongensis TaxID=1734106 RepID=A0A5M6C9H5_9TREE|nr:succinate dehydrogenase, cytochrome b556 subunit [Kwoniella shandongensis]KAA5530452.1 succinate dehydrogenase, cytochrome b556 subunit [Kwoniella shandongensis]